MRLVSLLPSATEIVYALGLGQDLAGVTFECDEPPSARAEKTIVVGGLDTNGMAPADIDRYVRAQLDAGRDLYTLHAQALAGLAPDLILTQDLCRVCALPSGHVTDALVAPCGYHLAGAAEQARIVAAALPGIPVWAIDGDGIVVRPGPRLVNGVEALAAIIHPQAVPAAPPGAVQRVSRPRTGAPG